MSTEFWRWKIRKSFGTTEKPGRYSIYTCFILEVNRRRQRTIREGNYTLFLDETIAAVEPYNVKYKDDIDYLLKKGSIVIDDDGFIKWIDDDLDTRYNPIKILAQNHSLFFVNQKLLMWRYPPEIFTLFDKVYILTYLFDASILKYLF